MRKKRKGKEKQHTTKDINHKRDVKIGIVCQVFFTSSSEGNKKFRIPVLWKQMSQDQKRSTYYFKKINGLSSCAQQNMPIRLQNRKYLSVIPYAVADFR